jgi:hypothetical protein
MPYQPFNVIGDSLIKSPWEKDFGALLNRGMQLYHEPQRLLREAEKEKFANILNRERGMQEQAETPFTGQNAMNQAAILQNTANFAPRMSEAEIKKAEAMAAIGGMQFPGAMGLVQGEEQAKRMWGVNDPRTKKVIYGNDTLFGQRLPTPVRLQNAISDAEKAMNKPGASKKEISDAQRTIRSIQMTALKNSGDPAIRDKVDAGENIQKTMKEIDYDVLLKGSGAKGSAWLTGQRLLSPLGLESKDYADYERSLKGLEALADQAGVFYGTPAANAAQTRLRKLLHDPRFFTNPNIMKGEFEIIKNIFEKEHQTFLDRMLYQNSEIQRVTGTLVPSENFTGSQGGGAHNDTINALAQNTERVINKKDNMAEIKRQQSEAKKMLPKESESKSAENKKPAKRYIQVNGRWVPRD